MSINESSNSPANGKNLQCKVYMLDDTTEVFEVPLKAKGIVLFSAVVQKLHLLESDYFGLQFNDEDFIPCWMDYEKPLLKQVTRSRLFFKFLLKFYTPDPGLLEEEYTRYLLALQIKRDLVSGDLFCQEHTAVLLASYIVQAELGNYCEEYASQMYISQLHLLPNQTPEIEHQIMEHHREHIGQTPAEADFNLLDTARKTELYGIQLHAAQDHDGASLHLAVSHSGILVFQNYTKINSFSWAKIRKLCFKRKKFLVKLHSEGMEGYKDVVEFYFPSRNWSKNFWKRCIEHHTFFRCHSIRKAPRNKAKVISHGSSFRYSGRTQKELVDFAREKSIKPVPFERTTSLRTMSALQSRAGSPRTGTLTSRDVGYYQHNNNPMFYGTQSFDRRQRPATAGVTNNNFMQQQPHFQMDNQSEQLIMTPAIPESALKSYQLPPDNGSNMFLHQSQLRTLQRQQQQQQMGFSYVPAQQNTPFQQPQPQQMYQQQTNMGSLRSNDASNWRAAHGLPPKAPVFDNNTKSPSLQSSSSHLDPSQFMIGHYPVRSSDPLLNDSPDNNGLPGGGGGGGRGGVVGGMVSGGVDQMNCRLSRTEEVDDIPETIQAEAPSIPPYISPQSLHHSVSEGGILKGRGKVETSVDDLTGSQLEVDQFVSSPRKLPLSHADSYFSNSNEDPSNVNYNNGNNYNSNYNSNSSYNNSYNRSTPLSTADHPSHSPLVCQSPRIAADSRATNNSYNDANNYNNSGYNNYNSSNNHAPLFNLSSSHPDANKSLNVESDDDAKRKRVTVDALFYLSKEVLMTERTFKKDLKVITTWLKEFAEEAGYGEAPLISGIVDIFEPLFKFHSDFLACLEDRLMAWEGKSGSQLSAEQKRIGDVFLSLPSILPLYTEILKQQSGLMLEMDETIRNNEEFEKAINDFESEKVCFLPLNSFLLKPAQRILYYKHILQKMISTMPAENHPDMPACCECLEELLKCIEPLESNLLSIVNLHKLLELQRGLLGIDNLLQPNRVFLREGCLQKLSRKGSQPRMFFLFSDKLVYTCRMTTASLQFKIHGQMSLGGMSVSSDDPRAEALQNGFVIYLKDNRCLVVAASCPEERNRWVNDLEEAITNHSALSPNDVEEAQGAAGDNPYPSLKSTSSSEMASNNNNDGDDNSNNKQSMLQHKANNTVHVCWHRSTSVNLHDHSLAFKNQMSGYLLRKFKNSNGWQKLWVSFTNFCLFFYKNYQDDYPLASLPLLNYTIGTPAEGDAITKDYVFKLQFKNHVYFFRAESHVTFSRWMEVIGQVTIQLRGSQEKLLQ